MARKLQIHTVLAQIIGKIRRMREQNTVAAFPGAFKGLQKVDVPDIAVVGNVRVGNAGNINIVVRNTDAVIKHNQKAHVLKLELPGYQTVVKLMIAKGIQRRIFGLQPFQLFHVRLDGIHLVIGNVADQHNGVGIKGIDPVNQFSDRFDRRRTVDMRVINHDNTHVLADTGTGELEPFELRFPGTAVNGHRSQHSRQKHDNKIGLVQQIDVFGVKLPVLAEDFAVNPIEGKPDDIAEQKHGKQDKNRSEHKIKDFGNNGKSFRAKETGVTRQTDQQRSKPADNDQKADNNFAGTANIGIADQSLDGNCRTGNGNNRGSYGKVHLIPSNSSDCGSGSLLAVCPLGFGLLGTGRRRFALGDNSRVGFGGRNLYNLKLAAGRLNNSFGNRHLNNIAGIFSGLGIVVANRRSGLFLIFKTLFLRTVLILIFLLVDFGNDFAIMFGILAENFHLDIVAVAVGFLGKLVILFNQIERRTADFAGNAGRIEFVI